jgi:uncharacterized integral membrane protein
MAIARMFVPLLILAGLALFALQNSSPVLPLVVLGIRTQALPLSVWMLGAIVAGAATTIGVSTLFSLSKFTAVRRSNQNRPAASAYASPRERVDRSWANTWGRNSSPPRAAATQTRIQDDWENRQPREEWDDWDEQPSGQIGRDKLDDDWDNWEGYTEPQDRSRPPVRTDFEAKQEPKTIWLRLFLQLQQIGFSAPQEWRV